MEQTSKINQEKYSEHRSHSRHHRHHRHHKGCSKNRKYYSRERQKHNRSELQFMLMCTAIVVLLMIILIPLIANLMESV